MSHRRPEIEQWLSERGHSPAEIEKIMARLDELDSTANRDSVFDAIDAGDLDIEALIKEALSDG